VPGRALFANGKDEDDFGLEDLVEEYPWALRVKGTHCNGVGRFRASSMSFSALQLDRQTWLYFELTDSEDDFLYLLAVVRTTAPQDAHKRFLREIFRSNGSTFDAEFLVSNRQRKSRPLFRERF